MGSNKTVTVEFEAIPPDTYTLSASVAGGHGKVNPASGTYDDGTSVTLTAVPDSGYRVKAWSGTDDDSSTGDTNTVTMGSNKTITVEFEEISITSPPSAGGCGGVGAMVILAIFSGAAMLVSGKFE